MARPAKLPLRTCAVGTLSKPLPRSAVVVASHEVKKNSLSFMMRTAEGAAELVVDALRYARPGRCVGIEEQVLRAPLVVGGVLERYAVKAVGARFGDHRNRGPARHSLLGVEIVGRNVHACRSTPSAERRTRGAEAT